MTFAMSVLARGARAAGERRRDASGRRGAVDNGHAEPGRGAPTAAQRALDASPTVASHARLDAALNGSARVRSQAALGDVLARGPATTSLVGARTLQRRGVAPAVVQRAPQAVVQRDLLDWASAGGGAAAGAYLGSYLDPFLPLGLGTLGGALVGGVGGYLAGRWLVPRPLWGEVNQPGRDYRTWSGPRTLADQLTASSPEFRDLRGRATAAVRRGYGRGLEYGAMDTSRGAAHSAGYKEGRISVDAANHPAVTVQNLVFETANAAQTGFFDQVRADYEDGSLAERTLEHYAGLLRRPAAELAAFAEEYRDGGLEARRSLLQEWGEWNSLQLARRTFDQISGRFTGETAQDYWGLGFGPLLELQDFDEYYRERGEDHRDQVQRALAARVQRQ